LIEKQLNEVKRLEKNILADIEQKEKEIQRVRMDKQALYNQQDGGPSYNSSRDRSYDHRDNIRMGGNSQGRNNNQAPPPMFMPQS
jgi:hypothetical protein